MPRLTDRLLTGLALAGSQRDRLVFDSVCPGLGVRLTTKGTRTFLIQWTDPTTKRKIREPLGVWGSITIEQARDAARARLGDVARGINPKASRIQARDEAARRRAEEALTLGALVAEWKQLHLAERRPRYAAEAVRAIHHAFPNLLKRPAARVTKADARDALDKFVRAGKTAMAGRTLAYARAAFRWAEKRGMVPGNPFLGLPIAAGIEARDRVLSDAELTEVWEATGSMPYPFGPLFRLATLTLQRREELAGMRWSEISLDRSTWIIPAARMKNRRPHVVHLSAAARDVLATIYQIEGQDMVFTKTGKTPVSGFSKAKATLDMMVVAKRAEMAKRTGERSVPLIPWRLHDLRRTGVSKLAALGIDSIVADKLLAHKAGKLHGVAAVYQRHEFAKEQAQALEAWAAHVLSSSAIATSSEWGSV